VNERAAFIRTANKFLLFSKNWSIAREIAPAFNNLRYTRRK
jgi:hypothetical protein